MRMVSVPVLGAAALVSSPALWQGFVTQQLTMETALLRFAVALVVAWVAISIVEALVGEPPRPVAVPLEPTEVDEGRETAAA
ncbi:hypothetical protein [Nocardioides dongkuii]|uniref:hypothetical protein n=1 Tax=Nocardioides dongkuii TaxID=2760089 RepID=UPI001877673B|nr:hypothetical protein [Nocardioides dongkuii]